MRPTFPRISEVEDQALGAAQLASYRAGIEYLLGESHADTPADYAGQPSTDVYQTEYTTIRTWWLRHVADTLVYRLWIKIHYGNDVDRAWAYVIQVLIGETWTTVREQSGTQNSYQDEYGTADISGLGLEVGTEYRWRLQVRCAVQADPADCIVHCVPWTIRERSEVTGWVTPHTFAAAKSAAADLNSWRTGLRALNGARSPVNAPSANPGEMTVTATPGNWEVYDHWCYRYRPDALHVLVQGATQFSTGVDNRWWQWRLIVQDDACPVPHEAVVYTSPQIWGQGLPPATGHAYVTDEAEIDLTSGEAAAALAAAGIALSFGYYLRLIIEAQRGTESEIALIRHAYIVRTSTGTPAGGWQAMRAWAHGDQDLGSTALNRYSNNIAMLYSGGERLWNETGPCATPPLSLGQATVHRYRWLRYLAPDQVQINWRPGYTYDPPPGEEWQTLDLDSVGVPYGVLYLVLGAEASYEVEEV